MSEAKNAKLRPGDLVEVKFPGEVLATLDAEGTLDRLPFMPEMVEFCGKQFRVSKRAIKLCSSSKSTSTMRGFATDDVVLLDELRCSGAAHDGCQKACTILWREAWLRKVETGAGQSAPATQDDGAILRARLRTSTGPTTYFCQASELLKATIQLSQWARMRKCIGEIRAGNCSVPEMAQRIGIWLFWRIRRALIGQHARGNRKYTPVESLNVRPGELIEVKPLEGIVETLNETGRNRGLFFTPDMRLLCGQQKRVERRLEKIIVDGTGEMREVHNTVYLEGGHCGCAHVAFGGCTRREFSYWREIWLRRPAASTRATEDERLLRTSS
jgi:hypothetical protein